MLVGIQWRGSYDIQLFTAKLQIMDPELDYLSYKMSTGSMLADNVPQRFLWSRLQLICGKWGTDRQCSAEKRRKFRLLSKQLARRLPKLNRENITVRLRGKQSVDRRVLVRRTTEQVRKDARRALAKSDQVSASHHDALSALPIPGRTGPGVPWTCGGIGEQVK